MQRWRIHSVASAAAALQRTAARRAV